MLIRLCFVICSFIPFRMVLRRPTYFIQPVGVLFFTVYVHCFVEAHVGDDILAFLLCGLPSCAFHIYSKDRVDQLYILVQCPWTFVARCMGTGHVCTHLSTKLNDFTHDSARLRKCNCKRFRCTYVHLVSTSS